MTKPARRGQSAGTCPCGKQTYRSRRDARAAARRLHPGETTLNAHLCYDHPDAWHIGHLKGVIIGGTVGRSLLAGNHAPAIPPDQADA